MKKILNISIGIITLSLLVGCATMYTVPFSQKVSYTYDLIKVQRPSDTQKRYGEYTITKKDTSVTFSESTIKKLVYTDDLLEIGWLIGGDRAYFSLKNTSNYSIQIMWNQAAIVGVQNSSHGIVHSGVKFSEINNPQTPTTIIANSFVTDIVIPKDNIYYYNGYSVYNSGWEIKPLVFSTDASTAKNKIGETISILLPLKVRGTINPYTFVFEITGVNIPN